MRRKELSIAVLHEHLIASLEKYDRPASEMRAAAMWLTCLSSMRINNDVYIQKHISDLCTNSDALASTSERLQEPETIPLHRHYFLHYHAETIKGDESDKYLGHRNKASRTTAHHHYRFRVSSMKIRAPAILGISIIPAALSQSPAYGQC
ncbi:hypothetical protein FS842_006575, partial [Serendipita sp. 407]